MSTAQSKPELRSEEKAIVESFEKLGEKAKLSFSKPGRLKFSVHRENLVEIAKNLRDEFHFEQCTNVTGTDFPKEKQLEIAYHFGSLGELGLRGTIVTLTVRVPVDDPVLPSLIELFPSANYHEREAAEMIGCVFTGHPNLTRLLLPEDWNDIPPMLKSYRLPGRLEGE
ncbi:MAG: NADH-quinone oxidoreductase subunit C [Nitrososphaerota archaeon]|nr:NADH-quinone oxidoreductase subunit C [Nitrososphaerota archaeon]